MRFNLQFNWKTPVGSERTTERVRALSHLPVDLPFLVFSRSLPFLVLARISEGLAALEPYRDEPRECNDRSSIEMINFLFFPLRYARRFDFLQSANARMRNLRRSYLWDIRLESCGIRRRYDGCSSRHDARLTRAIIFFLYIFLRIPLDKLFLSSVRAREWNETTSVARVLKEKNLILRSSVSRDRYNTRIIEIRNRSDIDARRLLQLDSAYYDPILSSESSASKTRDAISPFIPFVSRTADKLLILGRSFRGVLYRTRRLGIDRIIHRDGSVSCSLALNRTRVFARSSRQKRISILIWVSVSRFPAPNTWRRSTRATWDSLFTRISESSMTIVDGDYSKRVARCTSRCSIKVRPFARMSACRHFACRGLSLPCALPGKNC